MRAAPSGASARRHAPTQRGSRRRQSVSIGRHAARTHSTQQTPINRQARGPMTCCTDSDAHARARRLQLISYSARSRTGEFSVRVQLRPRVLCENYVAHKLHRYAECSSVALRRCAERSRPWRRRWLVCVRALARRRHAHAYGCSEEPTAAAGSIVGGATGPIDGRLGLPGLSGGARPVA